MADLTEKYDLSFFDATADAEHRYPNESIGYITKNDDYVALENTADEPHEEAFGSGLDPRAIPDIVVFVHSHPDRPNTPSALDQRQQKAWNVPWAIISVIEGKAGEWRIFGD